MISNPLISDDDMVKAAQAGQLDDPEDMIEYMDVLVAQRRPGLEAELDRLEAKMAEVVSRATVHELMQMRLVKLDVDGVTVDASRSEICNCGHTREVHDHSGCWVGQDWWNRTFARSDPTCPCRKFC